MRYAVIALLLFVTGCIRVAAPISYAGNFSGQLRLEGKVANANLRINEDLSALLTLSSKLAPMRCQKSGSEFVCQRAGVGFTTELRGQHTGSSYLGEWTENYDDGTSVTGTFDFMRY